MIGTNGYIKICDFDLGRILSQSHPIDHNKTNNICDMKAYTIIGTFHCNSPEMMNRSGYDYKVQFVYCLFYYKKYIHFVYKYIIIIVMIINT